MADHSHIEWTDATWNPVTGCSVVSPGCTNCYAMKLAGTRLRHHPSRAGLTRDSKAGPVWTGEVRFNEQWLDQPLRWTKPRMIFVCAHGDLFHEDVPDEWIDRVFAVMALAPQHTFQVLTKRAERMAKYMNGIQSKIPFLGRMPLERIHLEAAGHMEGDGGFMDTLKKHGNVYSLYLDAPWPLPNVWLGVSAEDQQRANERVPDLLATPAAVRFVSAEPLLGSINLSQIAAGVHDDFKDCGGHPDPTYPIASEGWGRYDALRGEYWGTTRTPDGVVHVEHEELAFTTPAIDWIIVGGESGPGARPMHPDWARSIRDQCAAAGVPFFFKQWGSWGRAKPRRSETPGKFALAGAGPHSNFWPAMVHQIDTYPRQITLFGGATVLEFIGKAAAGRLLDGVEHNGMPRTAS